MKLLYPSLMCLLATAPVFAADLLQPPDAGDRMQQRRAELRQVISNHGGQPVGTPDVPARTLTERERAELREQLRRESMAPRDMRDNPGRPRLSRP
ncbi:MAG: hypothetical protein J0H69_07940 [Burkholderiales bacterium]|nr:hypothetical protein [Burkholderiales bacterium]